MILFVADESGSPRTKRESLERLLVKVDARGKPDPSGQFPDPWYVVAAICVPETLRIVANDYLQRTKRSFLQGYDPADEGTEIKGSYLYHFSDLARLGKGPDAGAWTSLTRSQVEPLVESVFDLLDRLRLVVYAVAVNQYTLYHRPENRRNHRRYWRAHHWAFTYLQQRACEFLEYEHGRTQQGIFIVDRHSAFGSTRLMAQFGEKRAEINRRASWPQQFDLHLVEQMVFVDSHVVQLVQLADVVAYCVGRGVRIGFGDPWFKRVEPYLARRWATATYLGAGLTILR